jgi:hypothetical protein
LSLKKDRGFSSWYSKANMHNKPSNLKETEKCVSNLSRMLNASSLVHTQIESKTRFYGSPLQFAPKRSLGSYNMDSTILTEARQEMLLNSLIVKYQISIYKTKVFCHNHTKIKYNSKQDEIFNHWDYKKIFYIMPLHNNLASSITIIWNQLEIQIAQAEM